MNQAHLDYLASDAWADALRRDLVPWMDRVADLGDDVLEVGPGPGLTTDLLRTRAARVTAVELDDDLAAALHGRLAGTNVEVLHRDAAATGLASDRFSAATCFSMLHHVPTPEAQDAVLAELARVLRPGAPLLVVDPRDTELLAAFHEDDTFVPLPEDGLVERLLRLGFTDVELQLEEYELRLVARAAG
jgi:2-polyprenyl-3-methyl-5-hydroxy-6-metoxy-1,4-benzoquinol methylase